MEAVVVKNPKGRPVPLVANEEEDCLILTKKNDDDEKWAVKILLVENGKLEKFERVTLPEKNKTWPWSWLFSH